MFLHRYQYLGNMSLQQRVVFHLGLDVFFVHAVDQEHTTRCELQTSHLRTKQRNEKLQADDQNYQKTIDELIANEQFETAEEIEATNSKIQSYRRQTERNREIISQNKYEIEELKKAIEEINAAIRKIENMVM